MSQRKHLVLGRYAAAPRPTLGAALLLALVLSVPLSIVLTVIDMIG